MTYGTWQPIETAPKDGRAILGFDPAGIENDGHWYWPEGYKCLTPTKEKP